jgi:hypothetical protein
MEGQRKRIGPLNTAGSVAVENAKVYKEPRRGRIDPSLASRLSQILINQRVILESFENEKRIAQLVGHVGGKREWETDPAEGHQWLATSRRGWIGWRG